MRQAEKKTKGYLDRAAWRGTKRTKSALEEGAHEQAATTERMDDDS